jgi:hypothetical protein
VALHRGTPGEEVPGRSYYIASKWPPSNVSLSGLPKVSQLPTAPPKMGAGQLMKRKGGRRWWGRNRVTGGEHLTCGRPCKAQGGWS